MKLEDSTAKTEVAGTVPSAPRQPQSAPYGMVNA